jgi:ubiquinone biosynthesis protein
VIASLHQLIEGFLVLHRTTAERVAAIEAALDGRGGRRFRKQLGEWTTRIVPVEMLVPDVYARWRPLVHDAMLFVVSRLAAHRLAPKVIEQIELPPDTPSEQRLLRFIAKVPGLQKIGQVLARNRELYPPLRAALSELENGISDVQWPEIADVIVDELGPQLEEFSVRLESTILAEASVSAVVPFTWRNPSTGRRERGVFKVLKPHIPGCFAEDMGILQQLATKLARKHRGEGVRLGGFSETLIDVRLLLEHEVDFAGEQAVLPEAGRTYGSIPGVRVPRVIRPLCTPIITALSRENGVKITDARKVCAAERRRAAERLAVAAMAAPALSLKSKSLFHADPHAGNLLYDKRRGDVVFLDWALTERLSREHRRYMLLLMANIALRDADGVCGAIDGLRHRHGPAVIRHRVIRFLESMPPLYAAGPMDAMRLLDEIALEGIRFPAPLIMFRKAWFTLDDVMRDMAGSDVRIDAVLERYACEHYFQAAAAAMFLLSTRDWIDLGLSALGLPGRLLARGLGWYAEPQAVAS